MKKALLALIVAAVCYAPNMAWAVCANILAAKDGGGTSRNFCFGTDGTNFINGANIIDSAGVNIAAVTASSALKVDLSATGANGTAMVVTGSGTAGSAAAGVLSVQGIASMTPLQDNITQLAGNSIKTSSGNGSTGSLNVYIATDQPSLTNAQPGNFTQIGGTTVSTGNGTTNSGDQRTNIASDNSAIANWGQGATGSAIPSGAVYVGGNGSGNLTGITVCDNVKVINLASTTALLLVSGVSAKKVHICSINLVAAAATNVALIEGTTVTNPCDTGTAGMAGGATAATGWNFAANSGIAFGTGIGQVFVSATAADNVCLLASAGNQISGTISYTVY